ncbi:MAG: hypothetical protein ACI4S2_05990 [Lachnospiraceae bacterium]
MGDELVKKEYNDLIELAEKKEERISSTKDITMNKKLFFLLKKGADALKGMEERVAVINGMEREMAAEKEKKLRIGRAAVIIVVVLTILCNVVNAYTNSNKIVQIMYEYVLENGTPAEKSWVENRPYFVHGSFRTDSGMYDIFDKYKYEVFPVIAFITSTKGWLILIVTLIILYSIIAYMHKKTHLAVYVPKKQKEIDDAVLALQKYVNENEANLQLVPKACITSASLYSVINFYECGKADNLKEALNLADAGALRERKINISQVTNALLAQVYTKVNNIRGLLEDSLWY